MVSRVIIMVLCIGCFIGCTTFKDDTKDLQIQSLQRRVIKLESELEQKQKDAAYLEGEVEKLEKEKTAPIKEDEASTTKLISDKIDLDPKAVQTALKNARYYDGAIDGKMGRATERAIIDFQKDHYLIVDGVVGVRTWEKLKKYSE